MRCLNCHKNGLPISTEICPECGVYLPSLLRDVLPPGTLLHEGKYRLDFALGRGGFGITYRAVHLRLEQLVAVKEFYPKDHAFRNGTTGQLSIPSAKAGIYERSLHRFQREGLILARLTHPNIVRVQDLFEERGTAFLVMELISGETLREKMDAAQGQPLPASQVKEILAPLVDALDAVHREGVYHLDIKPDNVLLASDNRVVLIDFGAARQGFSGGSTQAFTMEYAPPEVLAGGDVGPESDIFELGMLLYEMLTGKCPPGALSRVYRDSWQPEGLDQPWRSLVESALQMDREARPQSVRDWWQRSSHDQPTTADPASTTTRSTIAPQRNPEPPSPRVVLVHPDGRIETSTLEEAIRMAKPGATIQLEAGTYRLAAPLTLRKRLSIQGKGRESTRVVCSSPDYVIKLEGSGEWRIEEIAFQHEGSSPADVMEVDGGLFRIKGCSFSGAVWDNTQKKGGDGLWLHGSARGSILQTDFLENGLHGIELNDDAQPILERNRCRENGESGIVYFDRSGGTARGNECVQNGLHGIAISEQADPLLEENQCRWNRESGIAYFGRATGTAQGNTCAGNSRHGICVSEQAHPVLENNRCYENRADAEP